MENTIARPFRLHRTNAFWITLVHVLALVAIPWYSWAGFWTVIVGVFVLAPLGINMGYHRLISHRGFTAPNWLTNVLVTLGAALGGGAPIQWAASHRAHHHFSDHDGDPHDARRGFWYSHILHLYQLSPEEESGSDVKRYAMDLTKSSYLLWLDRYWIWFAVATIPLCWFFGGLPLLLWGVFLRLALMWNIMWLVNSATHKWGYRTYQTNDLTTNCWWVGLLASGEGWHNNHHAFPSCVAHGRKWWEFDATYLMIRGLEKTGLITKVKHPVEPRKLRVGT